MLKIKFSKLKNIVIMEILEQTEKDTYNLKKDPFVASNGFMISSSLYPEICMKQKIFVKGADNINRKDDNFSCYRFSNEKEACEFVENACLAVKEFNALYNSQSLNSIETSMTFTTIIAE